MYRTFFQLERDPFEVSPDPYFLYPTAQHKEAVAGLYYGIKARKGFMVLTGEVGTGKTLVIRCVLDLLDQERVAHAYVFNSRLSSTQFLQYVAEDLGVPDHPGTKSQLLISSSRHLIERHKQGLTSVLVVDEAQHLTTTVLEEVRLLTNLETPHGKLLQIVLVGQPELDAKLETPELRQLKQRITLRFSLKPLSEGETHDYIQRRLEVAGRAGRDIFPAATSQRVFAYSHGMPRLINVLCDNAMVSAYSMGQPAVSPQFVNEAAADLRLPEISANGNRPRRKRSGKNKKKKHASGSRPELHPAVEPAPEGKPAGPARELGEPEEPAAEETCDSEGIEFISEAIT